MFEPKATASHLDSTQSRRFDRAQSLPVFSINGNYQTGPVVWCCQKRTCQLVVSGCIKTRGQPVMSTGQFVHLMKAPRAVA